MREENFKYIELTAIKKKNIDGIYKGFYYTELYKGGRLFCTIPALMRQPRKDKKYITVNCFKYKIKEFIIK